jgi:hypothetical protein
LSTYLATTPRGRETLGSTVMIDLEARLTVAYVMNQMLEPRGVGDDRALGILMAAYEGL